MYTKIGGPHCAYTTKGAFRLHGVGRLLQPFDLAGHPIHIHNAEGVSPPPDLPDADASVSVAPLPV